MPKVGTREFRVKGILIKCDMMYNKDGFHLKNFPEEVYRLTNTQVFRFSTEDELVNTTEEALHKYHKIISENRKVIFYSLAAPTNKVMNRSGYGSYMGNKEWIGREFADKIKNVSSIECGAVGFGFLMGWRVVLRVDADGTKYFDTDQHDNHAEFARPDHPIRSIHKKKEEFEIDWTPEREEFFKQLEEKCDKMFEQVVNFFKKPQDELLLTIDNIADTTRLLTS